MRIAQVSPVFESVPPKLYGGTERMVSYLSEELVSLGHEVFLFASGDSLTQAKLISPCESSLRLNKTESSFVYYQTVQLQQLYDWREHFDIVHFHTELFHLPMSHLAKWPHLTTLHGRLDTQEFQHSSRFFPEAPFVSISHYQKTQAPDLNWLSTVYHGLPENKYHLGNGEGAYLAFLGRICQDKGILEAIEIAYQTGMPLKIAAKIDNTNYDFYKSFVEKHFKSSLIEYVGEINDQEKNEFLGKAKTLLFPISWPEPFGLVMIEAMACGTPVVAFPCGSVREVIEDQLTGFIVKNVPQASRTILKNMDNFSRDNCRKRFEERFSSAVMTLNYLKLYEKVLLERVSYSYATRYYKNSRPILY